MTIHFVSTWVVSVILLSIRLGMVLVMTPVLGSMNIPVRIRVLLVLVFAATLVPLLKVQAAFELSDAMSLLLAALNEALWGGLLALGFLAAFSAFMVAGRVLDMQIGFGMANLVDPSTRANSPILGVVLNMYAIAWFLAADAHHAVLRALAKSFDLVPLGSSLTAVPIDAVVRHFGLMFSLGLTLVVAAVVCLLLIDIGMGLASRVLPQANVFILSMNFKIFAGLLILASSIFYMQPVIKKIFGTVFQYWDLVLAR